MGDMGFGEARQQPQVILGRGRIGSHRFQHRNSSAASVLDGKVLQATMPVTFGARHQGNEIDGVPVVAHEVAVLDDVGIVTDRLLQGGRVLDNRRGIGGIDIALLPGPSEQAARLAVVDVHGRQTLRFGLQQRDCFVELAGIDQRLGALALRAGRALALAIQRRGKPDDRAELTLAAQLIQHRPALRGIEPHLAAIDQRRQCLDRGLDAIEITFRNQRNDIVHQQRRIECHGSNSPIRCNMIGVPAIRPPPG